MIYLGIGIIIGTVMGFTGSGGALVAIPLFMYLLDSPLKDASVLSLIAVILAAALNYIPLYNQAKTRTSFIMFATSLIGSYVSSPFKPMIPTLVIATLLSIVSLTSLIMIWNDFKPGLKGEDTTSIVLVLISGFVLGVLTTLTGLGGGVLLMPLLLGVFKYNQKSALATSLLTISLSSAASLLIQVKDGFDLPHLSSITYLAVGILISVMIISIMTKRISDNKLKFIRKFIFTLVVLLAMFKIFQ